MALKQLVDAGCPVRGLILHGPAGYLPKLLAYIRRHMQVRCPPPPHPRPHSAAVAARCQPQQPGGARSQEPDSAVREACVEALAAMAEAMAEDDHAQLPGNSTNPVMRILFECLAEQKRESQLAACEALLKVLGAGGQRRPRAPRPRAAQAPQIPATDPTAHAPPPPPLPNTTGLPLECLARTGPIPHRTPQAASPTSAPPPPHGPCADHSGG